MKFQILDKDNNPIPLKELDAQAAQIWNKEVSPNKYVNPFDENKKNQAGTCWYSTIGLIIALQEGGYYAIDTWDNIVYELLHNIIYEHIMNRNDCGNFEFKFNLSICDQNNYHFNENFEKSLCAMKEVYDKYLELINYWQSLGYKPHKL